VPQTVYCAVEFRQEERGCYELSKAAHKNSHIMYLKGKRLIKMCGRICRQASYQIDQLKVESRLRIILVLHSGYATNRVTSKFLERKHWRCEPSWKHATDKRYATKKTEFRGRTIPTEPPLVGEVSAKFWG
jgi:transcriptional regulatory protein LevR